jgi:hypothetical protein
VFRGDFFVHLIKRKAVVVYELADKLLAHDLFGILNEPVLADVTPDFSFAVAAKGERGFIFGVLHSGRINIRRNLGELSAALSGLGEIMEQLTQGGARFTSLALGYFLSGFRPFSLAKIHALHVKHPCLSGFIRGLNFRYGDLKRPR